MLNPAPGIRWATARDGYRYVVRVWEAKEPIAHVVCLHGIVSHGGWYLASGSHLAKEGFAVHFVDRRGSGLNALGRGDVDRWQTWLEDVEGYVAELPGSAPRILLGISWGGTLAAAVARRSPQLLAGLGLLCPGLYSRKAPSALQRLALQMAVGIGLANVQVPIPLNDPTLFTNNVQAQDVIARDPLALWHLTMRFARANLTLTQYATERPEEIHVPSLAMLAELDPITVNEQVRAFMKRVGHEYRHVVEYPGASHTLEFEPDPTKYFQDLAAWCKETAASGKVAADGPSP